MLLLPPKSQKAHSRNIGMIHAYEFKVMCIKT